MTVDGTLAQTFTFDNLSRMVQAVDHNEGRATNTAAWEYDALNRVTAEVQNGLRVEKGYDANSNLEVLAYPSFKVVERTFNADNTLSQVWDGAGTIAINQYYAHGVPSQVNLGNGILLSLTQDDEDKETGRDYTLSGTTVYSMATVWDFRDNVAQETENRGGADIVKDFAYDNLDRITSETVDTEQSIWQYDSVGNWVSTNQNGTAEDRTVSADNEYNYITGMNPAHDANGNLVSDGTNNYVYDWANRLSEVWSGGQKLAEYTYDATNRRVSKYLPASSESFTFVYNDGQVIEEYLNSSLVRTYTYGAYIDDPLMVEYGGQRYFYLKDRRYSVTALTDAAGSIVETYEYSAFGRMNIFDATGQDITATGSTIGNPYGFTGRRFDAETGLWYYRNRMYFPALGRFLQRDPAGYVDGMNLYAYVQNNPMRYLDPSGLELMEKENSEYWQFDFDFQMNDTTDAAGNYQEVITGIGGTLVDIVSHGDKKEGGGVAPFYFDATLDKDGSTRQAVWEIGVLKSEVHQRTTSNLRNANGFEVGHKEEVVLVGSDGGFYFSGTEIKAKAGAVAYAVKGTASGEYNFWNIVGVKLTATGTLGSIGAEGSLGSETGFGFHLGVGGSVFFEMYDPMP